MKDWITKNINPLGMEKKNRGSLYSFAARVFAQLKHDALKAFNAHFPYLSDPEKLREHGRALSVPELPEDTETEYRDRVAAASFYLMKAGERSYILDRLQEHFGGRFTSREAFLQSLIAIINADDADITWARGFLDGILDPNIFINISAQYTFKQSFPINDGNKTTVRHTVVDSFINAGIRRNGRILRDGTTILDTELDYLYRNGTVRRDGSVVRDGLYRRPAAGRINTPVYRCSGMQDFFSAAVNTGHTDVWEPVTETFEAAIQFHYFRDGTYVRDGSINRIGGILLPLEQG
ncbi:MAG: hypothetical protein LBK83_07615 [Treponema sp.]|jgi:hypothetical protein|nr:hypothetical protein [Treponema sp.]